jgi:hypothetical protein
MLKRKKLEKGREKRRQNLLFWGYDSPGKDQIVTTYTMRYVLWNLINFLRVYLIWADIGRWTDVLISVRLVVH